MPMTTSGDPAAPPVVLRNGGVAIGGRPILRGIDLSVATGEFVALLGANGSGKSTLVRALTGLRPLSGGELELFGTPLARFRDWHRVGFVPQRPGATGGVPASVREVVSSGRLSRRRALRPVSRADRRAVDEAIELVGLTDRARDGVAHLSGGQQQRVLIARALAGQPDLFFLDEPTAGVDHHNQLVLAEALRVMHERGVTIVLVAHELGPLTELVDRAVVMRDGRIAYDGPPVPEHDDPAGSALAGTWLGSPHTHHAHEHAHHSDHAPHVAAPLENLS